MGKALQSKKRAGRSEQGLGVLPPPLCADHNSQKPSDSQTMKVNVTQSCPTLCDPMDYNSPGSSVHGDSPGKNTGELPCPPPRDLPNPGIKPWSPALQVDSLPSELPGKMTLGLLI